MATALVEHVVADAGAFLKKVPLQVRIILPTDLQMFCAKEIMQSYV